MDTTTVTTTIAMDLYPIKSNGKVTNGPSIVCIITMHFKKINFSCAEIIFSNTLIGNDIDKFNTNKSIKTLATLYSI